MFFSSVCRQPKLAAGLNREARVPRCTGRCCTQGLQVHNVSQLIYLYRTLCNTFCIKIALVVFSSPALWNDSIWSQCTRLINTNLQNIKWEREDINTLKTTNYISIRTQTLNLAIDSDSLILHTLRKTLFGLAHKQGYSQGPSYISSSTSQPHGQNASHLARGENIQRWSLSGLPLLTVSPHGDNEAISTSR